MNNTLYLAFLCFDEAYGFAKNPLTRFLSFGMKDGALLFGRDLLAVHREKSKPNTVVAIEYDGILHQKLTGCCGKSTVIADNQFWKVTREALDEIVNHPATHISIIVLRPGQTWEDVHNARS